MLAQSPTRRVESSCDDDLSAAVSTSAFSLDCSDDAQSTMAARINAVDDAGFALAARINTSLEFARAAALAGTVVSGGELRAILRRRHALSFSSAAPREVVRGGDAGEGDRISLKKATHAELLAAIEAEGAFALRAALREETFFKASEKIFRVGSGVDDIAGAVRAGAIDVYSDCVCDRRIELLIAPTTHETDHGDGGDFPLNLAVKARCFAFPSHPGALLLTGAIPLSTCEALVRRSLTTWAEPPQRRNTDDKHGRGGATNLWAEWKDANRAEIATKNSVRKKVAATTSRSPLDSLAWATVGYTYDWTRRRYWLPNDDVDVDATTARQDPKEWCAPFPPSLSRFITSLTDIVLRADATTIGNLHPEAGIINYYRGAAKLKQPMGGHRDDSERFLKPPVVSVSLGSPAVFLLGGADAQATPIAIILRNGDTFFLGGKSRLAFHGVARVFDQATGADAARLFTGGLEEEEAAFANWIRSARININVRQVVAAVGEEAQD